MRHRDERGLSGIMESYVSLAIRVFSMRLLCFHDNGLSRIRITGKISVKETVSEASRTLTCEGHGVRGCDDQAPTGAMKPYLVRALIQRGALRWTESAS